MSVGDLALNSPLLRSFVNRDWQSKGPSTKDVRQMGRVVLKFRTFPEGGGGGGGGGL